MSFPRYEKHKDSGVEWLGEVPEGWETGRFSRIIKGIKDGTPLVSGIVDFGFA